MKETKGKSEVREMMLPSLFKRIHWASILTAEAPVASSPLSDQRLSNVLHTNQPKAYYWKAVFLYSRPRMWTLLRAFPGAQLFVPHMKITWNSHWQKRQKPLEVVMMCATCSLQNSAKSWVALHSKKGFSHHQTAPYIVRSINSLMLDLRKSVLLIIPPYDN